MTAGRSMTVCGGLTPAYAAALTPVARTIRDWVAAGHPYLGFSAGSAIAADRAIVGGWRLAAAVESGAIAAGVGIDEATMLTVSDGRAVVTGTGRVWLVTAAAEGLAITSRRDGGSFDIEMLSA